MPDRARRKVEWLPAAARNRADQPACVAERNPSAAIRLGDASEAGVRLLVEHPASGRPGRVAGTRELVVYRIEPRSLLILRLLHGAQRWPA